MERRRLLASAVAGNVLTLTGTSGADAYVLTRNGSDIIVSENGGAGRRYASSSVASIRADLGASGDYLDVADAVTQNVLAFGEGGNDTLLGGGGADTLDGGLGNDSLDGGAGLDTVSYASRSEAIVGELVVTYASNAGVIAATVSGAGGAAGESDSYVALETLAGGSGQDTFSAFHRSTQTPASPGTTVRLNGNGGNDTLNVTSVIAGGSPSADLALIADGGTGDDMLNGPYCAPISTTLIGGDGNDTFANENIDSGFVTEAGPGFDTFNLTNYGAYPFFIPLGLEKVQIVSGSNGPKVIGNSEPNLIVGSGGSSETFEGRGGNDTIYAGGGDDTLLGGDGDDLLDPGAGNDSVDGGAGFDTISYLNRNTPVSGSLNVALERTGTTSNYAYSFRGHGVVGDDYETDTFNFIESVTGSAGNDTLNVLADDSPYWDDVPGIDRPAFTVDGQLGDDELGASTDYNVSNFYDNRTVDLVAKGGAGNDHLTSYEGLGVKLIGDDGDDFFEEFIDDSPLPAIQAGAGVDLFRVRSNLGVSYIMPNDLENLDVGGGSYNGVRITGNALDNQITVYGGGANDFIEALGGNDTIVISSTNTAIERIDGGAGLDTLSHALMSDPLTIVLNVDGVGAISGSASSNAGTASFSSVETLIGGDGADTFTVQSSSNNVAPTQGLFRLEGRGGNDLFNLKGTRATGGGFYSFETWPTINGGSGFDRIAFDDSALGTGGTYLVQGFTIDIPGGAITGTRIHRSTSSGLNGAINYNEVDAVDLTTTAFADAISIWEDTFARSVISSGNGVDTLNMIATSPAADINFISGPGDDVLNLRNPGPEIGAAVVRLYQSETLGAVNIYGGGVLQLFPTPNEANLLRVRSLLLEQGAKLDLANNPMIIDYTGTSPAAAISDAIVNRSLRSSTAETAPGTTLGVASSTEIFNTFPATFAGQSVDSTAVLVRYTKFGDINLDRAVNFDDLVILAQNYNQSGRTYAQGNLNYSSDGKVDFDDLVILAQNYNTGLSGALSAFDQSTAPAPTAAPKKRATARA